MADPQHAPLTPNAPPPMQFGGDNALADKIRAKYPGAYDDMNDAQLAAAIVQKHPEYTDLSLPYDMKVKRGDQWVPVRSETATPDERTHGIEYHPPDVYSAHNTYEGFKTGVMGASLPLAFEASVPQLLGGLVGGAVGSVGGQKLAKAAGAGETGQEVAGDAGGLVGGMAGGGISDWAVTKAHALFEALPAEIQQAIVKHAVSTVSPRAGNGIKLWNSIRNALLDKPTVKTIAELDATGENKPFAGGMDEYQPKPARALDATGENKPFAGGMDEAIPAKASPAAAGQVMSKADLSDMSSLYTDEGLRTKFKLGTDVSLRDLERRGLISKADGNWEVQGFDALQRLRNGARASASLPAAAAPGQAAGSMAESVAQSPVSRAPSAPPVSAPPVDPLLERLKSFAAQIQEQENTPIARVRRGVGARTAVRVPAPEEDLMPLLQESVRRARTLRDLQ